jgi:hypothetical protein
MVAHFFLFFLDWMFETRPKGLLGRLSDADFFQQIKEHLQTRGRHVPELALVKVENRLVQSFQKAECLWRDARLHDAAVVGLAFPRNQASLFHAVEETRHVRVVGNHAVANAPARQTFGFGSAENAKDVVLRARQASRLEELFRLLAEGISGFQESHKNARLEGNGGAGGFGTRTHGLNIVVTTTTVKRKSLHHIRPLGTS